MLEGIPEPDNLDEKEVYAFYGLAAYAGQVLEKAFVNLLVLLDTDGAAITQEEYDTIADRHNERTLGNLINEARKRVKVPAEAEKLITESLVRRNQLIHHFFADNAVAFMTDPGKQSMIQVLRELTELFQRTDTEVTRIYTPILRKHGITEDALAREATDIAFLGESHRARLHIKLDYTFARLHRNAECKTC